MGPGGRGGTSGGAMGGGAVGQPPYSPGENDRLPWIDKGTLDQALAREEGSTRPVLVLLYSNSLAEDCCASNFERAVFRYKPVVDLVAQTFVCFKLDAAGMTESDALKRLDLNDKKPAIVLLDAEGGLLHKQQLCVDPRKYLKVLQSAAALSEKRVKLKDRYLALRHEARASMDSGEYARALRTLEKMLKQRDLLTGQLLGMVAADQAEIELIGQDLLDQARNLHEKNQLVDAYKLFKEIKREFAQLRDLGGEAGKCAQEIGSKLREMGISTR